MMLWKRSGNKFTIKKIVGWAANVRPVEPKQGQNPRHIHIKAPPSILRRLLGVKK